MSSIFDCTFSRLYYHICEAIKLGVHWTGWLTVEEDRPRPVHPVGCRRRVRAVRQSSQAPRNNVRSPSDIIRYFVVGGGRR